MRDLSACGDAVLLPPKSTLDGFASAVAGSDGVGLSQLGPLDALAVRTRNTLYRIVVLRPPSQDILVQGGVFFPQCTRARLAGSSLGGSFLKLSWIGAGFRMEFFHEGQRIITSPVRAVRLESEAALPGPF
jgi:hypothetical protein